jgi:hypothetical protein
LFSGARDTEERGRVEENEKKLYLPFIFKGGKVPKILCKKIEHS